MKYRTLRDTLSNAFVSPFRRAGKLLRGQATGAAELDEEFWALQDISFEIKQGETVGIIGQNGAGKSTLLKILSRITQPTKGYGEIHGRVGCLLEVGTGFHQELTGRENIYLNGAILGMRRFEIDQKFDEIVDFAEVEKFIDTPVKHYSSGMYLRLAFSVAAHLEPEILIVDEVLAVGDIRFQKKCLNKMQDVGQEGRTVLFVSHNMSAITRLCERVMLLDEGRVVLDGPSQQVVSEYLKSGLGTTAQRFWQNIKKAPGREVSRLYAVSVKDENDQVVDKIDIHRSFKIEMEYDVIKNGRVLLPHFVLYNQEGQKIFVTLDQDPAWRQRNRPKGRYISKVVIPGNFLNEGMHYVNCHLLTLQPTSIEFSVRTAVALQIVDTFASDSARGDYSGKMPGAVRPKLEWSTELID